MQDERKMSMRPAMSMKPSKEQQKEMGKLMQEDKLCSMPQGMADEMKRMDKEGKH